MWKKKRGGRNGGNKVDITEDKRILLKRERERALEKEVGIEQDPDKGRETQELFREVCVHAHLAGVVTISSATFLNICVIHT